MIIINKIYFNGSNKENSNPVIVKALIKMNITFFKIVPLVIVGCRNQYSTDNNEYIVLWSFSFM